MTLPTQKGWNVCYNANVVRWLNAMALGVLYFRSVCHFSPRPSLIKHEDISVFLESKTTSGTYYRGIKMAACQCRKMYHFTELLPALHLNFKCCRLMGNLDKTHLDYSDLTSRIMMFKRSFSSDDTKVTAHHYKAWGGILQVGRGGVDDRRGMPRRFLSKLRGTQF